MCHFIRLNYFVVVPLYSNKNRGPPSSLCSSPVRALPRRQSPCSASSVASPPTAAIITANAHKCGLVAERPPVPKRSPLAHTSPASQDGSNHKQTTTRNPLLSFLSSLVWLWGPHNAVALTQPQCSSLHCFKGFLSVSVS